MKKYEGLVLNKGPSRRVLKIPIFFRVDSKGKTIDKFQILLIREKQTMKKANINHPSTIARQPDGCYATDD
ncbi:hypothetical protein HPP92_028930 [Vanilla planifolia]|uniref:Uncharacterized protein n=1 Tax=Vanilla planifolia TaxID=51239 RepID=A0A835U4X4_VANPL|nr:hypothetical protein HPP92_028930 [Vanilla planifolia]KAG0446261.1 hypothetical protein HPP92_028920 [Vanilla planifolia]